MLTKTHLTKIKENILLTGESGVGKSHLAKWIHKNSNRTKDNFYHVNITTLTSQLFESELFGHKKGSFTGATQDKKGFCEKVGNGTLFIDEIGELDLEQQKKILTLVEERTFYSVGCSEAKIFKGVLIFATNKHLEEEVKNGKFREDLYFRIRSFTYKLGKLNECRDKFLKILEQINSAKVKHQKPNLFLTPEVMNFLNTYDYPGNYRELRQVVDYLVFMSETEATLNDLPIWITEKTKVILNEDCFYEAQGNFEKEFLTRVLTKYQGRINYTAQMINLSKVTLISKIKKYDINIKNMKINKAITA